VTGTNWNVTSTDWIEILIVLVLIGVVAVMAASEVALTRTNRVRALRLVEEQKSKSAERLLRITENPAPYLNVVLLITLLSTIGGTTIATSIAVRHFDTAGEIVSTVVMTLLLFVFAEVTPKTYAIQQTDRVALRTAPLLSLIGGLLGPFAKLLLRLANVIMPGKGLKEGPFITEQEIRAYAEVASDEAQIEEGERDLIHSIFEFGDRIVREVMVPRPDIVAVEDSQALRDVQALVLTHGYSRVPVFHEELDNIVGICYAKDVLKAFHQGKHDSPLTEVVREAHFVPETKKVAELLREMQKEKFHIAIVTDEYGSVSGLVTLEDLLEELVGEITDEYDKEEAEIAEVEPGVFRVSGKVSIDDVNDKLGIELPDEGWDTVAGFVLDLFGKIPEAGEERDFQGLRFRAEEVQGRRIAKVLITRLPDPGPEPQPPKVEASGGGVP
jgi:putative hemolysin